MSESKRKSVYYTREDLTGLGESKVQIIEIAGFGSTSSININGKTIWFEPLVVEGATVPVKSYLVIEKFSSIPLTTVDLVYGNIDMDTLCDNEEAREEYFEKVLTRENMELITRKYAGTLPILSTDYFRNQKLTIPQDVAIAVAKAVYGGAHIETRSTTTKINNDMFGREKVEREKQEPLLKSVFKAATGVPPKSKKKKSFFDKLFESYEDEPEEQKEIVSYVEPTTSYTSTQGVLFYRSGSVILDDRICSKYNYCTKDAETGIKNEVDSFLITGVDENRMKIDEEYRRKFVEEVLRPSRLKNARNIQMFPYIGGFTDEGKFENDVELTMAFRELTQGAR